MLRRLGVEAPAAGLEGVRQVFGAWCAQVPFDNVRKMIWLRRKPDEALPGSDAEHFYAGFLESGTGGTCWSTANALFELLGGLGFQVARITGSMRDMGFVNHGSVRVAVNGAHWLVDPSILNGVPVEFADRPVRQDHPVFGIEMEPDNGTHVARMQTPPWEEPLPCRFGPEVVDRDYFQAKYEASRQMSPFNQRLYARRNRGDAMVVLFGNTRYVKTAEGVTRESLTADGLCEALHRDMGMSERLVREWVDSGSLVDSMEPMEGRA
ncbi:MAG: arylamine N-acetyltransferase [Bryobacterales bacterium]|nr:arylamine N-acetyltransferase [Bryobacterales bacterium]